MGLYRIEDAKKKSDQGVEQVLVLQPGQTRAQTKLFSYKFSLSQLL